MKRYKNVPNSIKVPHASTCHRVGSWRQILWPQREGTRLEHRHCNFMPNHCWNNAIWGHCCTSGNYCTVIHGNWCTTISDLFPLLCNNDLLSCRMPTPVGRTRQTYKHGRVQKVFFAHHPLFATRPALTARKTSGDYYTRSQIHSLICEVLWISCTAVVGNCLNFRI
jgi:hypothetical protein